MAIQVDLSQLAGPRVNAAAASAVYRNRTVWLTRYVLPLTLVAGFGGTLAYSFREAFLPAKEVTVVPVVAVRAEIEASAAPLFQSAGWVEARPTPVIVSALQEGVVEDLLVIEGQELKKGDAIARLIDADAKLHLRDAEAELDSKRAALASSRAALAAAEIHLKEPVELHAKTAEAEALLARVENELARLPSQVKAAQARAELAGKERTSRQLSGEGVSRIALARSESEVESAAAALAELESQRVALVREQAAKSRRVAAMRRQLELKVEEHRRRDEAQAAVELADARLAQATVALDASRLRLSRTVISAPVDGKVLALVARPGTRVMGLAAAAAADASTVVTMYDPTSLQIRADVRLEDVSRVFSGQQVRIDTAAVKGAIQGSVITATSLTDIQKNTLQVKVAIDDPSPVLKPDMLVQVTFLSPRREQPASGEDSPLSLAIPPELVQLIGEESHVWLADRQNSVARLRAVTLGGMTTDGLREVKAGLAAGDRLIAGGAESLHTGDRIRIVGEAAEAGSQHGGAHDHAPTKMKRL